MPAVSARDPEKRMKALNPDKPQVWILTSGIRFRHFYGDICIMVEESSDIVHRNPAMAAKIKVTSTAFREGGRIPRKYTCDGDNVNPPLTIGDVPAETKSLVLIVDDPDAPGGTWDHWVVWNIPPITEILENSVPGEQGMNDSMRQRYSGPCPPPGTHRYFFKVYALDTLLNLDPSSTKHVVEEAMKGHILAQGELIGRYSRD